MPQSGAADFLLVPVVLRSRPMQDTVKLDASWKTPLAAEFEQPYMRELRTFLLGEMSGGKTIYPPPSCWFAALDATPLHRVSVMILGQDPYHGPGQAHGLCFSVQLGVPPPPSLVNIFKEIEADLGLARPTHGHLQHWADQGVLLLNSVLTVEQHQAAAHRGKGWETFTDAIVRLVADKAEPCVFLLWGADAQRKAGHIKSVEQGGRHLVLKAPHPSPLSAHRGFLGCRHFSKANEFLIASGRDPIDWALPGEVG